MDSVLYVTKMISICWITYFTKRGNTLKEPVQNIQLQKAETKSVSMGICVWYGMVKDKEC